MAPQTPWEKLLIGFVSVGTQLPRQTTTSSIITCGDQALQLLVPSAQALTPQAALLWHGTRVGRGLVGNCMFTIEIRPPDCQAKS